VSRLTATTALLWTVKSLGDNEKFRRRKKQKKLPKSGRASRQDIDEVTRLECFHDPARISKARNNSASEIWIGPARDNQDEQKQLGVLGNSNGHTIPAA
jgi:hypothetical protein